MARLNGRVAAVTGGASGIGEATVRRFVKDERVERRAGIVTVNHLIPRASVPRYAAAIERAAVERHLRLMVSGPLAPYAFADNW